MPFDSETAEGFGRTSPGEEAAASAALRKALRGRALRLLARREYSRSVLQERLLSQGRALLSDAAKADHAEHLTALVTEVLDRLQAEGLQADERVADALVRRSAARHGNLMLAQRLAREGLSRELVHEAVAGRADSDWQRAWHLWQSRFGEPATEPRARARQARYLASRGFSADVVARVLAGRAPP